MTTRLEDAVNWARKFSLFQYPFVTACCGMEFMSVAAPRYDIARFGAEFPRFSPRQADLLIVVGTIVEKMGPVLVRVYEQMAEPKWVMAFGVCASSGGFYQNYTTMPGIDQVVPVDVYVPGCPPRPEQVLDGLMMLQDLIARGAGERQQHLRAVHGSELFPSRQGRAPRHRLPVVGPRRRREAERAPDRTDAIASEPLPGSER